MGLIAKKCLPKATQATDRFHVQQLALEAVQDMRIAYRWQALEAENQALDQRPSSTRPIINQRFFPMATRLNNCWLVAVMCSIKSRLIGRPVSNSGPLCC
ncbi:transposase [Spirosoma sp. SC4-14]|uniref:transposase n=1 Tax=Spirosoma sp. SC4-14 TaxID=3128900 RepID=UPI0030D17486